MNRNILYKLLGNVLPDLCIEKDNEGQLIIYTGMKETEDGELIPFDESQADELR